MNIVNTIKAFIVSLLAMLGLIAPTPMPTPTPTPQPTVSVAPKPTQTPALTPQQTPRTGTSNDILFAASVEIGCALSDPDVSQGNGGAVTDPIVKKYGVTMAQVSEYQYKLYQDPAFATQNQKLQDAIAQCN